MTRYGRFIAVPTVALALLVGRPSVAQTPPASAAAEAGTHFHRGVELYKDADFAGAVVEFKRAYDLAPNWRVLYDLGQAYYQLAHYAQALQAFDAYLAQGGTHIPSARKTAVEREREELASRVARVEITVNADGADIRIDDESAGTSPLKSSVLVSVGHRKITISKEGRAPIERFVDVAAGDLQKLSFDFPPRRSGRRAAAAGRVVDEAFVPHSASPKRRPRCRHGSPSRGSLGRSRERSPSPPRPSASSR